MPHTLTPVLNGLRHIRDIERPMCGDEPETNWLSWYTTSTQQAEAAADALSLLEQYVEREEVTGENELVKIPRSIEAATMMVILGEHYLEQNDPNYVKRVPAPPHECPKCGSKPYGFVGDKFHACIHPEDLPTPPQEQSHAPLDGEC